MTQIMNWDVCWSVKAGLMETVWRDGAGGWVGGGGRGSRWTWGCQGRHIRILPPPRKVGKKNVEVSLYFVVKFEVVIDCSDPL